MRNNKKRRGFTIVELVIVIAVIGILAAILIPTFVNLTARANRISNESFVKNINTQLAMDDAQGKKSQSPLEALKKAHKTGFHVDEITPYEGNDIVWDETNDRYAIVKGDFATNPDMDHVVFADASFNPATPLYKLWKFYDTFDFASGTQTYSIAAKKNWNVPVISDLKVGFDICEAPATESISYIGGDSAQTVTINTNGGALKIRALADTVYHFGNADKVDVEAVKGDSYHENGSVQLIAVKHGHVKLEGKAEVNSIYVYNDSTAEQKATSFEEVKITVNQGVDVPRLSRSAVAIQEGGTKVCTIVTDQAKDVYLFNEGIYEQIKTVDAGQDVETHESAVWADSSTNSDNTQNAARQLANEFNGTYDESGNIADQPVTINETNYTVKFNEETRTFETYAVPENPEEEPTKVTDPEIIAAVEQKAEVASEGGKTAEEADAESALKGSGTEKDPFLVYDYETMQKISDFYDKGYYYFSVDLEKTDGGKIDLKDGEYINLNGSFDGKGVKFTNVNAGIFGNVGSGNANSKKVSLSNFDVDFDGGFGIVQACGTSCLEFNKINAAGYLLEDWNAAVFLRYGTADVVTGGFDYSVTFTECSSRAEVYSSTNASSAILIGHGYQGSGNTVTINVDEDTDSNVNNTILYYTGTSSAFGYKYYNMTSGATIVNIGGVQQYNGSWGSFTANKMTGSNVVKVISDKHPAKDSNGSYQLAPEADTSRIVVSLNWQYTEWEENFSSKIADLSGVGGTFSKKIEIEVDSNNPVTVLDKINSIEIKTGQAEWGYEFKNGVLTLNMTTENQYIDGHVTLIVEQFTRGSSIAKYKGSLELATKTTSADWVIK